MVCDSQKAALSDSFSNVQNYIISKKKKNVQIIEQKQEKKNLIPIFSFIHWVPFTKDTVITLTHTPYSFPRSDHVSRFLRVNLLLSLSDGDRQDTETINGFVIL